MIPVRDPAGVYRAFGQSWAEPDIEDGARKLKALHVSPVRRAELARLGLPPENLALAGFSQGTMLSLHVGLRRKAKPAAETVAPAPAETPAAAVQAAVESPEVKPAKPRAPRRSRTRKAEGEAPQS